MTGEPGNRILPVTAFIERHRDKLLGAVACVLVYALLGFLVAPWLIKQNAVESVQDGLNAELRIANVAVNPFVLSLRVDGLELDDPTGDPLARIEDIFVNFQVSSLFRWAWTFDELERQPPAGEGESPPAVPADGDAPAEQPLAVGRD